MIYLIYRKIGYSPFQRKMVYLFHGSLKGEIRYATGLVFIVLQMPVFDYVNPGLVCTKSRNYG